MFDDRFPSGAGGLDAYEEEESINVDDDIGDYDDDDAEVIVVTESVIADTPSIPIPPPIESPSAMMDEPPARKPVKKASAPAKKAVKKSAPAKVAAKKT